MTRRRHRYGCGTMLSAVILLCVAAFLILKFSGSS